MHTLSNGVIVWALQYIPGGLAALIAAIMPVYVVLISLAASPGRKSINPFIGVGLLLGSIGVLLIFRDHLSAIADTRYLMGIIAVFLASLSWTAGSLLMKSFSSSLSPVTGMAIQLCSGGILLLAASVAMEDLKVVSSLSLSSIGALAYLVVFGSLLTYLCYIYAVKKLPVGLVSIYSYINPFVAILIGYIWLQEPVTWITISAFVTTLSGVYFINRGYRNLQGR
jgi:drug/metabolite transporter (DMT)-like permease